jgi:hypothetical protein
VFNFKPFDYLRWLADEAAQIAESMSNLGDLSEGNLSKSGFAAVQ